MSYTPKDAWFDSIRRLEYWQQRMNYVLLRRDPFEIREVAQQIQAAKVVKDRLFEEYRQWNALGDPARSVKLYR